MEKILADEYDAGMGTSVFMWELLSEILAEHEEKLPESLNNAIYALRDGNAKVTPNVELRGMKNAQHFECPA